MVLLPLILQQVVGIDPAQIGLGHLAHDLVDVHHGHSGVGARNRGAVNIGVSHGVVVIDHTGIHSAIRAGSQIHIVQVDPAGIAAAPGHILGDGGLVDDQRRAVFQRW